MKTIKTSEKAVHQEDSKLDKKGQAAPNEKTDRRGDAIRASCQNLVIIDVVAFLDIQFVQINGLVLPVGVLEGDNCGLKEF